VLKQSIQDQSDTSVQKLCRHISTPAHLQNFITSMSIKHKLSINEQSRLRDFLNLALTFKVLEEHHLKYTGNNISSIDNLEFKQGLFKFTKENSRLCSISKKQIKTPISVAEKWPKYLSLYRVD
jgi:hypothetical protein